MHRRKSKRPIGGGLFNKNPHNFVSLSFAMVKQCFSNNSQKSEKEGMRGMVIRTVIFLLLPIK